MKNMREQNVGPAGRCLGGSDKSVVKDFVQNGKFEHPRCLLSQGAVAQTTEETIQGELDLFSKAASLDVILPPCTFIFSCSPLTVLWGKFQDCILLSSVPQFPGVNCKVLANSGNSKNTSLLL